MQKRYLYNTPNSFSPTRRAAVDKKKSIHVDRMLRSAAMDDLFIWTESLSYRSDEILLMFNDIWGVFIKFPNYLNFEVIGITGFPSTSIFEDFL